MKSTIKSRIFVITLFSTCFALFTIENLEIDKSNDFKNESFKISAISGKIHINNNWTETKAAGICTGEGIESDPYVIEDLIIDAGGSGSNILIVNSIEYFRIENCTLSNCGSDFYDAGIELISVDNAELVGNQFSNPDGFGIILNGSNSNIIRENFITAKRGISVRFSNDNRIYLNNLQNPIFNAEQHNSTGNKWSTPKKMKYIYNSRTFTKHLGNYWSGIGLTDNNNDGIGDTPVIFDQHLPSSEWQYIDYHPLIASLPNYDILGESSKTTILGYDLILVIGVISIITYAILNGLRNRLKL
ncbi:MAG: NosD domain-containing protein [Promethearchaeota archaeon]